MQIQLPTGKTLSISTYDFFFVLKEENVEEFFQSCIADDLGTEVNYPFSHRPNEGKLEFEETPYEPEDQDLEEFDIKD